jgi:hypothetical protein
MHLRGIHFWIAALLARAAGARSASLLNTDPRLALSTR